MYPEHGSSDERNLIIQQNWNEEKCAICGKERLGHKSEHAFKAKWDDVDITNAQDILTEIKKSRGEE